MAEIKCPRQHDLPVTPKWCDRNKHKAFCGSCATLGKDGPEISIYQQERLRDERVDKGAS